MSDNTDPMMEAMARPGNDKEFKLHVLKKLESMHKTQVKSGIDFKIFKVKAYFFIAILVGVKDQLYKYFIH